MDCVLVILLRIPVAAVLVKNAVAASIDLDGSAGKICVNPDIVERVRIK